MSFDNYLSVPAPLLPPQQQQQRAGKRMNERKERITCDVTKCHTIIIICFFFISLFTSFFSFLCFLTYTFTLFFPTIILIFLHYNYQVNNNHSLRSLLYSSLFLPSLILSSFLFVDHHNLTKISFFTSILTRSSSPFFSPINTQHPSFNHFDNLLILFLIIFLILFLL